MPAGDITVSGVPYEGNNRCQGNSHSWTGYELKLAHPIAKPWRISSRATTSSANTATNSSPPAKPTKWKSPKNRGVWCCALMARSSRTKRPGNRGRIQRDLKDEGRTFGLMFYHAAGYIGPIPSAARSQTPKPGLATISVATQAQRRFLNTAEHGQRSLVAAGAKQMV